MNGPKEEPASLNRRDHFNRAEASNVRRLRQPWLRRWRLVTDSKMDACAHERSNEAGQNKIQSDRS
jgi:hypothetical protein